MLSLARTRNHQEPRHLRTRLRNVEAGAPQDQPTANDGRRTQPNVNVNPIPSIKRCFIQPHARQERLAPLGLLSSMADLAMHQSDLTNDEGSEYLADAARYFRMKAGGATSEELQAAHDNLCRRLVALGPDLGDNGDQLATNGGKPMPAARPSPVDRNPATLSRAIWPSTASERWTCPVVVMASAVTQRFGRQEFNATKRNRA